MTTERENRRPLATRQIKLFHRLAGFLGNAGISANMISVFSVIFALGSGITLAATGQVDGSLRRILWLTSAALVQLRLLCNMIDGLVAVECGKGSAVGEIYNEVPDRIADAVTLIGLGFAIGGWPGLGYLAAVVAVFVAYVRAFGVGVVGVQAFYGPMAKPQRMFTVTVVCLYCGIAPASLQPVLEKSGHGLAALALGAIILGGVWTAARRLTHIAKLMKGHNRD